MSAWRRIATEKLAKHRHLVESSESLGMLWIDLWLVFVHAHSDPADEETIRAIYDFAWWCITGSGNADVQTPAICSFYEHLPTERRVRERLPHFLSRAQFLDMKETFRYHLGADEYDEFVKEFLAGTSRPTGSRGTRRTRR